MHDNQQTTRLILLTWLMAMLVSPLLADELKIGEFWIPQVQVKSINDGQITYQTSQGSEAVKRLTEVKAVRMTDYPQYEQAVQALEKNNADQAVALLESIADKPHPDWANAYIGWAQWRAYAKAGDAAASVRAYAGLATSGADAYFLARPPVALVANANDRQRSRIKRILKAAMRKASEDARPWLQSLLDVVEVVEDAGNAEADVSTQPAPAAVEEPDYVPPAESAVVLPVKMQESPATKLLSAGQFAEALAQIDADLKTQGNMAVDLYLQGIAYLYQADETQDLDGYKDAGLAFMRVMTYFPRSDFEGRNLIGGSLLELAYIHDKLGVTEKATELYDRAANELDEESDPNLSQRLQHGLEARPRPRPRNQP